MKEKLISRPPLYVYVLKMCLNLRRFFGIFRLELSKFGGHWEIGFEFLTTFFLNRRKGVERIWMLLFFFLYPNCQESLLLASHLLLGSCLNLSWTCVGNDIPSSYSGCISLFSPTPFSSLLFFTHTWWWRRDALTPRWADPPPTLCGSLLLQADGTPKHEYKKWFVNTIHV